ncbi:hypothetical protein TNCT_194131 [Trichonephila clavata]|uniref:Uncharacterized protein n=1 Tax=Trichonephila clavata TaxID=2740835 RepID=A0A8X6LNG8_TRICU|nr:hypothetical protein TNCT_194131 [Trichonephila clavata]
MKIFCWDERAVKINEMTENKNGKDVVLSPCLYGRKLSWGRKLRIIIVDGNRTPTQESRQHQHVKVHTRFLHLSFVSVTECTTQTDAGLASLFFMR